MRNGFKVLDGDAHLQEPLDIWDNYFEPAYYDRRPIAVKMHGKVLIEYRGQGDQTNNERAGELFKNMEEKYGHAFREDWSIASRVKDMDKEGWDVQVCLPTNGLMAPSYENVEVAAAMCRAYSRWAHDFCSGSSRTKMVAPIAPLSIEAMVEDTRYAVEELGAVSVMMPKPVQGHQWHDPDYDPFWNLAVELDFPVSFHGVESGVPKCNARYQGITGVGVQGSLIALEHAISFPFENMTSMGHLIYTGILERFPQLRVSMLEGNAGWLPFWLGRLDDHAHGRQDVFFHNVPLAMKPSEYFKRQVFVACDGDEETLPLVAEYVEADNIIFNTDYPHLDAPYPGVVDAFLRRPLKHEHKRKILWDNSVALYGDRVLAGS